MNTIEKKWSGENLTNRNSGDCPEIQTLLYSS